MHEVLTNSQMAEADKLTIEGGYAGYDLMCNAGESFVDTIVQSMVFDHCFILCGPGNNGGDGFVIAKLLRDKGCMVTVASLVAVDQFKGDAAKAAQEWGQDVVLFKDVTGIADHALVIDAVFGTGFSRSLDEDVIRIFDLVRDGGHSVVAVDIPSGVDGNTGQADPHTLEADMSVTFFRKKLGHVLMPGMALCGDVNIRDIGIADDVVATTGWSVHENEPELWQDSLPFPSIDQHKYHRGHVVVLGGDHLTGAARLASEAAMRSGAGLCTIVSSAEATPIYRSGAAHVMVESFEARKDFAAHIKDERRNAIIIGPGAGLDDVKELQKIVLAALATKKAIVLDADALSCFEGQADKLFKALHEQAVLTPHEGEFTKLFGELEGSKVERAGKAAEMTGAVILLKGPDTIIAGSNNVPVVNNHASPYLATGGSGDVLAGMIGGFLAQGVDPFDAACIASWMHGEASLQLGAGMVSSDLIEIIPDILSDFA